MSPERARFFRTQGYLLLNAAVSRAQLLPVREQIVSQLKRAGIGANGRGISKALAGLPAFQQIAKLSQVVVVPELTSKVTSDGVRAAVAALMQSAPVSCQSQLLLSPPKQGPSRLDGLNWHTDLSRSKGGQSTAIQAFVLLDDVDLGGGGTQILAGSHRVQSEPAVEGRIREALREGRAGEPELHRHELSIVELCGKAGDVYLMDMRVLHTPSINASTRFRMVATLRFFVDSR